MRAIQLKCYHTGRLAPEADRIRMQERIDAITIEMQNAPNETERLACYSRIQMLKGNYRMPRG